MNFVVPKVSIECLGIRALRTQAALYESIAILGHSTSMWRRRPTQTVRPVHCLAPHFRVRKTHVHQEYLTRYTLNLCIFLVHTTLIQSGHESADLVDFSSDGRGVYKRSDKHHSCGSGVFQVAEYWFTSIELLFRKCSVSAHLHETRHVARKETLPTRNGNSRPNSSTAFRTHGLRWAQGSLPRFAGGEWGPWYEGVQAH